MDVYVSGKKIRLNPSQSIGKGGEADVFDIGNGKALKVFKQPTHPDYQGLPQAQQAACDRIAEHQQKLRDFPNNLPDRVIKPESLATDKSGKKILGYTMPLIKDAEVLLRYGDRAFRQSGISSQIVVQLFQDLHATVAAIHKTNVVIGDFNDLNVLVIDKKAYLIDADSFQYGRFLSKVFTARFVDPLLCNSCETKPVLQQPYTPDSDWYAFAVMLMQCLLFVDPYGGVYKPKDPSNRIPHDARPLKRITVFHPEVKYPKPAVHYGVLPDDLLHYFHQIFEKDKRGDFHLSLLENLQWTKCKVCQTEHARNICPKCSLTNPTLATVAPVTIRGTVTATRVFFTEGVILFATVQSGKLYWIYHDRGEFKREDNSIVFSGELDLKLKLRSQGKSTLLGKQGQLITLTEGKPPNRLAAETFDANECCRYWIYNGQLIRDGQLGAEYIGDVLAGQTHFWVGSRFGFGFYRAGNLNVAFVFDTNKKGINDNVKLPNWGGQLIDANCTFSEDKCWFLWATQEQGRTVNRCAIIRLDGSIEATAKAEIGDNSWLSTIRGKCAAVNFLLAATDEGIVRVQPNNSQIVKTKEFPDTEPFVDANSQLFPCEQGLYVVNQHEIRLLKIT